MNNGCPYAKNGNGDDRRFAEAIASAHGEETQDAERQVRESDLELKRVALRPAYGLGYHVRDEEVPEEATDPASAHTHAEKI